MLRVLVFAALAAAWSAAGAAERDPLDSPIWADIVETELAGAPTVYDDAVRIAMPDWVEEPHSVPLVVKLRGGGAEFDEIAVFAEDNPIRAAARIFPYRPLEAVGMNIRLERSTAVRAAARDRDGVWHVAHAEVTVNSPGGCSTLPDDAASALGDIALKRFDRAGGASRLRMRISHPMHTGFAADDEGEIIAAYHVERVEVEDERGALAEIAAWAALSHDPMFQFDLAERPENVRVTARDTAGLVFEAAVPAPSM